MQICLIDKYLHSYFITSFYLQNKILLTHLNNFNLLDECALMFSVLYSESNIESYMNHLGEIKDFTPQSYRYDFIINFCFSIFIFDFLFLVFLQQSIWRTCLLNFKTVVILTKKRTKSVLMYFTTILTFPVHYCTHTKQIFKFKMRRIFYSTVTLRNENYQ